MCVCVYLYLSISCSPPSLPPILPPSHSLATDFAAGKTLVVGVGGVESNFLVQSVPCIKSHDHPDYPAILVFIEYLTALEVYTVCVCVCIDCTRNGLATPRTLYT